MPKYRNMSGRTIPIEIPGDVIPAHPGAVIEIPVACHHPSMRLIEEPLKEEPKKAPAKAPKKDPKPPKAEKAAALEAAPEAPKKPPAKSIAGRKPRRSRKQG